MRAILTINGISILFITFILMSLSTFLFYKAAGSLSFSRFNMISLAYYALATLSVIGTTFFAAGFRQHHIVRLIRHHQYFLTAWLTTLAMMIIFPAVILLCQKMTRFNPESFSNYMEKETKILYPRSSFIAVVIASIVCISAIIYTFYTIGLENNAILNMIQRAEPEKLNLLRAYAKSGFPGNQYIKNIFALSLTPFISYISYIYARKTKEKKWIFLTLVLFLASSLILFYDLEKMPILAYWLTFLVLSIYYGDFIKMRYYVILGIFMVLMIFVMYIFIAGKSLRHLYSLTDGPISRIFFTTPIAYVLHLEVFNHRHSLLRGQSLPSFIGRLAGFDVVSRSGSAVMEAINFLGTKTGSAGVYSGLFLGEAFANFGKWGLFISMFHVPFVFFLATFIFNKLPKNPFTIALYGFYTMNLVLTLHSGYTDYIFSMNRLILIVVACSMILFIRVLGRFWERKKVIHEVEIIDEEIEY